MLRVRRDGPLVAARLRWLDHAPQDPPENKLDRGRLSVFPAADIAGVEADPQEIFDRIYTPTDARPAIPSTHWKHAAPVTEPIYRHELARLRWAERARPADPARRPRRAVDPAQMPLPSFERENSI